MELQGTQKLPNATAVLVLGILSIVGCCCYSIPGLVFGIIALVLAKKDKEQYLADPSLYSNYSNLNTGRILAIIGLIFSTLSLLTMMGMLIFGGQDALMEWQQKMLEMQQKG